MSGELETLLRLVAEGRISAEEAAPIVAALQEARPEDDESAAGGGAAPDRGRAGDASRRGRRERRDRDPGSGMHFGVFVRGAGGERDRQAEAALAGRRLRIFVAERGRQVVNLKIPLAAAGFAIDRVPGLSPDDRSRIVDAIRAGMTGPILEVDDEGDEVRIDIE